MNNVFQQLIVKGKASAWVLLGAALFILTGCVEKEPPMISVSPESIQIGIEADSYPVEVRSNDRWTATVTQGAEWCTLSHSQGFGTQVVNLNVTEYNAPEPRTAIVRFSTTGTNALTTQVTVTQSAANSTLMISPEQIDIDNDAQTIGMAISSNDDWTITADKPDFLSDALSQTSGNGNATINIPMAANDGHNDRAITLTVSAGTGTRTVTKTMTINQSGMGAPSLFVSETSLSFPAEGGTDDVVVITNIKGDLKVSCDFPWCLPVVSATDSRMIQIEVNPNLDNVHRDAIVTVIGEVDGMAVTQQIRVTQAGAGSPTLTLIGGNVQVNHHAHTALTVGYIKANAALSVTVSTAPAWVKNLTKGTESGVNGTITFDVDANTEMTMRQGVINLVASVGNESIIYPVNVIQTGVGAMELQLYPEIANVVAEGETKVAAGFISEPLADLSVAVTEGPASMFTETPAKPISNGGAFTVAFKVAPNQGSATRTATLLVTARMGNQTVVKTISVVQAGVGSPDIRIAPEVITIPQAGAEATQGFGTQIIGATASTTISGVTIGGFTATPKGPDGAPLNFIGITAGANSNSEARTQAIEMVATQGGTTQVFVLTIVQPGTGSPVLTIPQPNLTFTDKEVTDFQVVVMPEGTTTYKDIAKPSWITGVTKEENVLKISMGANTSSEERSGTIYLEASNGDQTMIYTIGVVQAGVAAPNLTLAINDVYATATQTSLDVAVVGDATDATFKFGVPETGWITQAEYASSNVALTLAANTGSETRTQTISAIVTRAGVSQTLTLKVTQAGVGTPDVVPGVTAMQFGPDAETDVKIHLANHGTEPSTVAVKASPSWIDAEVVDPYDVLSFDVKANETHETRSGVISLEATKGGQKAMISISVAQAPRDVLAVSLSMSSVNVGQDIMTAGAGATVLILHLDENTATLDHYSDAWLAGSTVSGSKVNIDVAANKDEARTGTLIVKVVDQVTKAVQYLTLVVNQAAFDAPEVADLQVTPLQVTIAAAGTRANKQTINLPNYDANNYESITAISSDNWLTVPEGDIADTKFIVYADANTGAPRTGSMQLIVTKSNGEQQPVTIGVTQLGAPVIPDLTASLSSVAIVAAGTDANAQSVNLPGYDSTYTITATASRSWIMVDHTIASASFKIGALANTGAERNGTVTLTITKKDGTQQAPITIQVDQSGASPITDLLISPASISINATGGKLNVSLPNYNKDNPDDRENYESITAKTSDNWFSTYVGEITTDFPVTITANSGAEREGTLTITVIKKGGVKQAPIVIPVTQSGASSIADLTVSLKGLSLVAAGTKQAVHLPNYNSTDYTNVTAVASDSWMTVDHTISDTSFEIGAAVNAGGQRTGTVQLYVTKKDGAQQAPLTINVTQEAVAVVSIADLQATPTTVTLVAAGTDQTVNLPNYNSTDYTNITATASDNWITVDHTISDTSFEIGAGVNEGARRTGTVTLTVTKANLTQQTLTINVAQEAAASIHDLIAASDSLDFLATPLGAFEVELLGYDAADYINVQVSSSNSSWLTGTFATAPHVEITATTNTSTSPRTGTITVTVTKRGGTKQYIPIDVRQEGVEPAATTPPATIIDLVPNFSEVHFTAAGATNTESVDMVLQHYDAENYPKIAISRPTWIVASDITDGKFTLEPASDYAGAAPRTGKVVVSITKKDETTQTINIDVTQFIP